MGIQVRPAHTAEEFDALFQTRYQVFVREEGYMPVSSSGRILDQYDAFPITTNLIALAEGEVVGGVRMIQHSPVGSPADDFYNFANCLPPDRSRVVSAGMLCLRKAFRHRARLTGALLRMGMYWGYARGASHIYAAVNPEVGAIMTHMGFRAVDEPFVASSGLNTVPMVLDMADTNDGFITFCRRQGNHRFAESFERAFFEAGETIIQGGAEGREAYLLLEGDAEVLLPGRSRGEPGASLGKLKPGEIFGEMALFNDSKRTASVVAESDVDVMVLQQAAFEKHILPNPDHMRLLMRVISRRLTNTLAKMERQIGRQGDEESVPRMASDAAGAPATDEAGPLAAVEGVVPSASFPEGTLLNPMKSG